MGIMAFKRTTVLPKMSYPASSKSKSPTSVDTPLDIDLSDDLSSPSQDILDNHQTGSYSQDVDDLSVEFLIEEEKPVLVCPHCGSSIVRRAHRGFIGKYLLKSPPLYRCMECSKTFNSKHISSSENPRNPGSRSNNH
jgi:DNA-directed RNA polymerase subunit RPC12/RpoP